MKTKVNPTGENEVELSVEVPAEAVKKAYDRTVAKIREEMQLPGFRKGRVPVNLVIQNVGADFIRGEALEDAIPEWGDEALKEAGLYDDAVGTSDLQVGPLDESRTTRSRSRSRRCRSRRSASTRASRCRSARWRSPTTRSRRSSRCCRSGSPACSRSRTAPCRPGDFVLMDLAGSRDGEPIEGAQGKDQMYEVGRGNLIPGFEEELVGVKAGEEKSFDITFPEDYHAEELAGQPATFTVTVKEIKEKVVPELDDAFAADVSEFETIDELRADVRERLQAAAEAGAEREFRAAAVEKAVEHATLAVPSTMVDREAHRLYHQLEERVGEQGLTMEVYLGVLEKTEEDIEEEMRPQAEFIIKRQLVLEAIAQAEALEVTDDDITEVVKHDAEALGRDHLQLLADLEKSGRREALRDEMLVAKAADFVADASVSVPMTEAEEAAAEESADVLDPDAD